VELPPNAAAGWN